MKFAVLSFSTQTPQADAAHQPRVGTRHVVPVFALFLLLLAACAPQSGGDPAETVEQYLTAKVASDEEALRGLLCAEMEADLRRESTSFASVDAQIEGMDCMRDGDSNVVTCTGQIVATYGTENTSFPLTSYRVVLEDGEWKWCGEAQ